MRKRFISTAVVLAPRSAAAIAAPDAWAHEKMTIGISYQNLAFPYVAALQKAAENACKALDVTCIEADAVNDTNKELNNVESMLSKGINCLAFEAASLDASVASINAANKKGVPVVQFNGKASGGDYVTFVGSAQTDSGVKLGQFLEGVFKKAGKDKLRGIYLRGVAGQITDIARNDGMKNYLEQRRPRRQDRVRRAIRRLRSRQGAGGHREPADQGQELRFHRRQQRRHDPRRAADRKAVRAQDSDGRRRRTSGNAGRDQERASSPRPCFRIRKGRAAAASGAAT